MTEQQQQVDERVAEALYDTLLTDGDENLTQAVAAVAHALQMLGNAGAVTPAGTEMGAIEGHGKAMLDASEHIAGGLHDIADAIRGITE